MSNNFIQPSFAAGELSPQLYARVDLGKYHVGAALMENFVVDFRGGAFNRNGTEFVCRCRSDDQDVVLVPFQFSTIQTYMLEFGNQYMRVVKDGALVLEASTPITGISQASEGLVTAANTYINGDWVFLDGINGMTELNEVFAIVDNATVTGFSLLDLDGNPIDTTNFNAYTSGGTAARVFTLTTPYAASDLPLLKFTQSADVMTLTHPSYAPRELTRTGNAAWTLTQITFSTTATAPTGVTATASAAGAAVFSYVVTAVGADGQESVASARADVSSAVNIGVTAGHIDIAWAAVAGAQYYNVYKASYLPTAGTIPQGVNYGWIGDSVGVGFIDNNIVPDFTKTPPLHQNPFAIGAITSVTIVNQGAGYVQSTIGYTINTTTGSGAILGLSVSGGKLVAVTVINGGSGYAATDTITITGQGTGSGAAATAAATAEDGASGLGGSLGPVTVSNGGSGYVNPSATVPAPGGITPIQATLFAPVVVNGVITAINVNNPGQSYLGAQTVTITDSAPAGSGATATLNVNTSTGRYPGAVGYFQQRLGFGGSNDGPETIWLSQPGAFHNFDVSNPVKDDDAITATLASRQVNNIKYMIGMPGGLIVLTSGGAWQVSGGAANAAITPSTITATPQAYNGCADVEPITINYDILYVQAKGAVVRDLSYNFYVNIYTGIDISLMSNHLLQGFTIVRWAYAEEPFKVVWVVRSDGKLLSLTYLKEQEIYGWAHHHTLGLFKSVGTIVEGNESATYLVVKRFVQGKYVQFIERMHTRDAPYGVEDSWFLDCALMNELTYPNATVTASTDEPGPGVIFTADTAATFSPSDVGKVLRMGGGIATITAYIDGMNLEGTITREIQEVLYGDPSVYTDPTNAADIPLPQGPGDWSLTAPITTVTGLDHLEGQIVSVLADGSVMPQRTVVNGSITLDHSATKVVVGLPYSSRLQTLNLDTGEPTIQGKRKLISALTVRVAETRGLQMGPAFDDMAEYKMRDDQPMGQPILPETGDQRIIMGPDWQEEGVICIRQDYPLPAQVLGIIPEITIGDTKS